MDRSACAHMMAERWRRWCADANASLGRGSLGGEAGWAQGGGATGPFGLDHANAAGRRLRTFLELRGLTSLASHFHKPFYGTWQHPGSRQQHQLDHIFTAGRDCKRFKDAGAGAGQLIDSDHALVSCKMRLVVNTFNRPPSPRPTQPPNTPRYRPAAQSAV